MDLEIARDPIAAQRILDRELASLDQGQTSRRRALNLSRALAASMAGQDSSAFVARAREGPSLPAEDPLAMHLALLDLGANAKDDGLTPEALAAVSRPYWDLPPESAARACLGVDLAFYFDYVDQPQQAFLYASDSYRNSTAGEARLAHAQAASMLAYFVAKGNDFAYARELHTQALAYYTQQNLQDLAADELSMRAHTSLREGRWAAARRDFERSVDRARLVGNTYAVDYGQAGVCEAALSEGDVEGASKPCAQAYEALGQARNPMAVRVSMLRADFLNRQERFPDALSILDPLLSGDVSNLSLEILTRLYETRGQALMGLGRESEAYADLREAYAIERERNQLQMRNGAAVTNARFQTGELRDRLVREQRVAMEKSQRLTVIASSGGVILALLLALIGVMAVSRRKIRHQARTDPLTRLANRRATRSRMESIMRDAVRDEQTATLALIDIDHFKHCNDTYGHEAGDAVLCAFARLVEGSLRSSDIVGRWGGEEFLVVLPGADTAEAIRRIASIREAAEQLEFDFSSGYTLRFSAGLVGIPESCGTIDACVKRADDRLYLAKRQGRDRTCWEDEAPPAERESAPRSAGSGADANADAGLAEGPKRLATG